jgi:hypothetical protein
MDRQWRMNSKERKELAISEIILIVLAVIGVAVVVWLAWARPLRNDPAAVNSFADCKAARGIVQTSYPEVCITTDGKRFVNPDQKVTLPSGSGTDTNSQTSTANRKNLTISQWKVMLPYPDGVSSLSYHLTNSQTAAINLDDVPGDCKGSNTIRRATADGDLDGTGKTPQQVKDQSGTDAVKQIGSYYYMFIAAQTECTDDQVALQQIHALSTGFTGNQIQQLVLAK